MSKHTPGPWDIYTGDDESIRIATDERRICEMDIYIDNTDMANARLIAAAPDLLEACRLNLEAHSLIEIDRALRAARDAIAKAEGRDA